MFNLYKPHWYLQENSFPHRIRMTDFQKPMKINKSLITAVLFSLLFALQINAQLLNPGSLDPTFGSGGDVFIKTSYFFQLTDIKVQSDGKIVATGLGGYGNAYRDYFTVIRYNPDGTPDGSFGIKGMVFHFIPSVSSAKKLAIQDDGKIIVAGQATEHVTSQDFTLIRLNENGTLDLSFGELGIVRTDFSDFSGQFTEETINDLLIQGDGKIVVLGSSRGFYGGPDSFKYSLARYNTDGNLDTEFGLNGRVSTTGLLSSYIFLSFKILPDGKLLLAGREASVSGGRLAVARYNSNGTLDELFGDRGFVAENVRTRSCWITSLAVQPDGKFLVAGNDANGEVNQMNQAFLFRFNPDGSLDPGFGSGGKVFLELDTMSDTGSIASSIMLQSDGKILLFGQFHRPSTDPRNFGLARFLADGHLDQDFGTNGIVQTYFGGAGEGRAMAIQPDGKIVGGGLGNSGPAPYSSIVRYLWRKQKTRGKY